MTIREALKEAPMEENQAPAQKPVISISNLVKYYGKKVGVDRIDLEVMSGDIFGFLGPNGAGKTTAINLMLDIIRPDSGTVRVFGQDARRFGKKLRSRIGFIPGEMGFYENMKGWEYLRFFAGLRRVKCDDRIRELARFFFNVDLDRKVGAYSRGMKQLLGIIQAFMASPELYILDEPTANLDPLMTQRFYELIHQENSRGKTIFLSSHMLGEVERVCRKVCIIRDGKIAANDTVENIRRQMKRYIQFSTLEPVTVEELKIEGVSRVTREGNRFKLEITGDLGPVFSRLSTMSIENFDYRKMRLEEIFWEYFSKEDINGNGESQSPDTA